MTDADHFLAAIDQHPGEPFYLAMLADFLEERGDPAAEAWRWLASEGKVPYLHDGSYYWFRPTSRKKVTATDMLDFWLGEPREQGTDKRTRSASYLWAASEYLAARTRGWTPERKDVVR